MTSKTYFRHYTINSNLSEEEEGKGRSRVKKHPTLQARALDVPPDLDILRTVGLSSHTADSVCCRRGMGCLYLCVCMCVCVEASLKSGSCLQFFSLSVLWVTWSGPPSDLARVGGLPERLGRWWCRWWWRGGGVHKQKIQPNPYSILTDWSQTQRQDAYISWYYPRLLNL